MEPPNGIPGPDHKLSKVTPCPEISNTNILSIAKANPCGKRWIFVQLKVLLEFDSNQDLPVGEISETHHSVTDVSDELSTKTCIKYSNDIIFTAKFPKIPAVCRKRRIYRY
jgi:hypothetical protein